MTESPRSAATSPRPVAAFDFDGTLTYTDSFVRFLTWKTGGFAIFLKFLTKPQLLISYALTRDRGDLKIKLLHGLLGAITKPELEKQAAEFAELYVQELMRPSALKAWESHAQAGHERVIVTASPEILVKPFGEALGADRVIGTLFAFDSHDRLIDSLPGKNNRGAEKVRRLTEAYGESLELIAAYGDTKGDFEMLKAARNAHYRVFKDRP